MRKGRIDNAPAWLGSRRLQIFLIVILFGMGTGFVVKGRFELAIAANIILTFLLVGATFIVVWLLFVNATVRHGQRGLKKGQQRSSPEG